MIKGPTIEVTLIKLVNAPCNSPCSVGGTSEEIIPCNAGPHIPPKDYGIKNTNIIQLVLAKPNNNKPIPYKASPK